ncbi:GDSL-type esterase/lipase family protein [Pleurocapsa sp. PCC 7319]|uniref:GDSL-type esterase/lipase family protein n=1 Tax=Pleurocapsa sp. PCC 7319 TaxID=118161 RepID=UPI00034BB248|nr:GDSL-type esterase/lipase family protein [Pleurocapsa sp. PCC 7319]
MQAIFSANSTLSTSNNGILQEKLKRQQPLKVVALGDSLIYGYGDFVGGGWVERLRRQWMSPQGGGHVLYNLGVRGDRVAQVSQRLEQEFSCRGELRNRLPDLILLSVGVNDSSRVGKPEGKPYTNLEDFRLQIAHLLNVAQNLCPVLFIGMTPVDRDKMPFMNCLYYNHLDQYRYKEATLQACQQRNIPYLDIFDLWLSRGEDWLKTQLGEDGLHPNVSGYQTLLADIMAWESN